MGIEVKICGINSVEAADAALRAGADFGGLNFHPASPRFLSREAAHGLSARLRGKLRLVAVLADADDETIAGVIAAAAPDILQLHGKESVERVSAIRARFHLPLIKALAIAEASDLARVPAYEAVAEMLLFDAKPPAGAARGGGFGAAFDWTLLKGRSFSKPWFLAGGLNPENVARAVAASGASRVDVSSGVESAPGVKSAALIGEFVSAARLPERLRA